MKLNNDSLLNTIEYSIQKKASLFDSSVARYCVRSMFACLFIILGTAIAVTIGDKVDHVVYGLGKLSYSFMFSWALVMIVYMNAELGTSNMMYMTIAVFKRSLKPSKAFKILGVCILFNLIAAIIGSYLMAQTSAFHNLPKDHFLFAAVDAKLLKTPIQIFIEGIFTNILVNTAIFSSMRMKDDSAKISIFLALVFIFVFLGFEHVIANFVSFPMAFFSGHAMEFNKVVINLIFALLGNYVGGGIIIGLTYAWLNNTKTAYVD